MNVNFFLVTICLSINLQLSQTMSGTILKQSLKSRYKRSLTDDEPIGIRDIILSEIYSTERELLSLESQTDAARIRRSQQLQRQNSRSEESNNRRQSRQESQLQDFESLFSSSHAGHRHSSSSWRKLSARLYKQMVAQNVTNSRQNSAASSGEEHTTYATVHIEENKLPQYTCPVGQWACPTPKRNRVTCIDKSKVCDYHIDCPKADDENPVQCAFYRESQLLIERQQREIEDLRLQIQMQEETNQCHLNHISEQLLNHEHQGSRVAIGYNEPRHESCAMYGGT